MSFPGSTVLASFAALGVSVALLAACDAQKLSLGTNTQFESLTPAEVTGTVSACGANAAHPNVCCTAGPNEETSCVAYPDAPFKPCPGNATAYPDPRSCCPLDGASPCTPVVDGGGLARSGAAVCNNACPPGWYVPVPPDSVGFECCESVGNWTECHGGPSPSAPCPACPQGWQVPQGAPERCCKSDPTGVIECFSQAGIAPAADDGGVGDAADDGGVGDAADDGGVGDAADDGVGDAVQSL
jgi:hypothetical protein